MTLIKTIFSIIILATVSCCTSSKNTTTGTQGGNDNAMTSDKQMMEAGYTKGTVVYSAVEGDCPYTIETTISDNAVFFDPINLEQEFKADGTEVWFKYGPLKMMNRCDKASPVSVIEMMKVK